MTKLRYIKFITSQATRGFSGLVENSYRQVLFFTKFESHLFLSSIQVFEIRTVVILYNTKTINKPNIPFYCWYHCIHLTYAIRIRRDDLQYFSVSNLKRKEKHELTNQNIDIVSIIS